MQFAMYLAARKAKVLPKEPGLAFCYDMLNRVSRSFAVVIQQLPDRLRDAVCVFYLVLRALDTVEDDMSIPDDLKIPLLRCFHEKSYNRYAHFFVQHFFHIIANYKQTSRPIHIAFSSVSYIQRMEHVLRHRRLSRSHGAIHSCHRRLSQPGH